MIPLRIEFEPPLERALRERVTDATYTVLGHQAELDSEQHPEDEDPQGRLRFLRLRVSDPARAMMALHGAFVDEGLEQLRLLVTVRIGDEPPLALLRPSDADPKGNMALRS